MLSVNKYFVNRIQRNSWQGLSNNTVDFEIGNTPRFDIRGFINIRRELKYEIKLSVIKLYKNIDVSSIVHPLSIF